MEYLLYICTIGLIPERRSQDRGIYTTVRYIYIEIKTGEMLYAGDEKKDLGRKTACACACALLLLLACGMVTGVVCDNMGNETMWCGGDLAGFVICV